MTPALEASWETYESVGLKKVAVPGVLTTEMMLPFSLLESLGMPVALNYLLRRATLKCAVHMSIYHRLCLNSIIISTTYA